MDRENHISLYRQISGLYTKLNTNSDRINEITLINDAMILLCIPESMQCGRVSLLIVVVLLH